MNMEIYRQVAVYVDDHPNGVGRSQVAGFFGFGIGTAIYHLEKCVQRKLVRKVYTWLGGNHRGWVYYPLQPYTPIETAIENALEEEQEYEAEAGGAVAWSELYGYRDHEILTADYNAQEIQNGG